MLLLEQFRYLAFAFRSSCRKYKPGFKAAFDKQVKRQCGSIRYRLPALIVASADGIGQRNGYHTFLFAA